jgi:hypothetical protein
MSSIAFSSSNSSPTLPLERSSQVVAACGRSASPSPAARAKRGGARVIYLHVSEVDWIFLLHAYSKGEAPDLHPQEKKVLRRLARQLKAEARRAAARFEKEKGP